MPCFTLCLPLLDHTQRRATQRQEEVNLEHLSSEGIHAGIPSIMDSSSSRDPLLESRPDSVQATVPAAAFPLPQSQDSGKGPGGR